MNKHDKSKLGRESESGNIFHVGDLVALRSNPQIVAAVVEVIPGGPEYRYGVFQDASMVTYYESQLQTHMSDENSKPCLNVQTLHAYITSLHLLSPSTARLASLRSGRIQFVPYQYRPVLKMIRADRPRLLIADEVGVGKTIEAGLIIKELQARMELNSILIICPKALVAERKWDIEMRRFDEYFTALDGRMLKHCIRETHLNGEWPDQYAKVIVPFSLFDSELIFGKEGKRTKQKQGLLSLDPPPKFDLVIVDEAHHIRNSETYLHQGVRYFCDNAQAALFLTATPVQLGSNDLFTLLNVLRPDLVIDHPTFEHMAAPNGSINIAIQHCRSLKKGWQEKALECLKDAESTDWGRVFLRESPILSDVRNKLQLPHINDGERIELIRNLEELYTFSLMVNRTRRRDIGEFTTRKPETLSIEFTGDQKRLHDNLLDLVARMLTLFHGQQNVKFMMTTIRRQAASCLYGLAPLLRNILEGKIDNAEFLGEDAPCTQMDLDFLDDIRSDIEILLEEAEHLDTNDPKLTAFIHLLKGKISMEKNKVLVFTTFRHSISYLAEHMKDIGIRFGVVHGGVPDSERSEIRQRFALPKEDSDALDVLLSSEVGCEGLDFQFCDMLVNYDLPWNPMRIEQRIGRIDRYGQQSKTIAVVNMITPGTVDADIYDRCLWRIGVFEHSVGGNEQILGQISKEINDIADNFSLTPDERNSRLQQMSDNVLRQVLEEQILEEKEAELFGLNVPKKSWEKDIQNAESYWLSASSLQRLVETYLSSLLGRETNYLLGTNPMKTLRLNQNARSMLLKEFKKLPYRKDPVFRKWGKWLKGSQAMLQVTFDQLTASNNISCIYMNVQHPLIKQAANYFDQSEPVCVNLLARTSNIEPGDYLFAIYQWRKYGVKTDEQLIAVTTSPELDSQLLYLLPEARHMEDDSWLDKSDRDALDSKHYELWSYARTEHSSKNRDIVQHRIQSLTISNQARCDLLRDLIKRTTNQKIQTMKTSELARAEQDFSRRLQELNQAADSADIVASAVVFGKIKIQTGGLIDERN